MSLDVVGIDHVAIRVTDLEESLRFYRDLLGMRVRDRDRYEAGEVPYVAVAAGGRHVHLVPVDDDTIDPTADATGEDHGDADHADAPLGGEHVCFLLRSNETDTREELEEVLEAVATAGYEVEPDEPRKRYGAYGRDWAAYVRDPDGRRVELKLH